MLVLTEDREVFEGSLRTVYVESCKKASVIPASYFVRHMDDTQIEMKHHGLGPQGIKPIAIALVVSTSCNPQPVRRSIHLLSKFSFGGSTQNKEITQERDFPVPELISA